MSDSNSSISLKDACADLEALLGNLPDTGKFSDRAFADSLINGPYGFKKRGGLSDKQRPHVFRLLEMAMGGRDSSNVSIGNVAGIVALISKAKGLIKWPKIVFEAPFGKVKIWIQGKAAKYPGAIGLTVNGMWFGRIQTDGEFQASGCYTTSTMKDEFLALLNAFSADPAGVGAHYGKLAGRCCFCQKSLEDPKSLAVGYGPTCASNYQLPWGQAKVSMADVVNTEGSK